MSDDVKKDLREWFGLDGGEFMGTGMTIQEWTATQHLERIHNSYVTQDRREQKRRLSYVMQLAGEGLRIREQPTGNFGSAVLESAVEHVMEGQWEEVVHDIDWVNFTGVLLPTKEEDRAQFDPETLAEYEEREKHYRELWAIFRGLLQAAYDTRPETDENHTRH